MNTKTMKIKTLGIILSLALVLSLVAVTLPARPVHALATSVIINQPTTDNITYVAQGGTVTLKYILVGSATNDMEFWIYNATSGNIGTGTASGVTADNTTVNTKSISLNPVVTAGSYNVKIRANANPATEAIGTGVVIVDNTAPTVTLLSPTASGIYYQGGSTQTISWTASDASSENVTVTLDYTTDGGANWVNICTSASYAQGANSRIWTVPAVDTLTGKVRITVTDAAGNACTPVLSANNFTIAITAPTVNVTAPNGSESWDGGNSQNITFNANSAYSTTLAYLIQLSTDGGANYTDNITSGWLTGQAKGDVTRAWTVSNTVRSSTCRIKVWARDQAGNTFSDTSNANFTIKDVAAPTVTITAPTAGVQWYSGVAQSITFSATDLVAGNLANTWYYSTDGGSNWNLISSATETQGTKTKSWTPALVSSSSNCKIKVTSADGASPANTGEGISGTFTITVLAGTPPTVAVNAPNTVVSWEVGSTQSITWTASQSADPTALLTYKIELSLDSGATYPTVGVQNPIATLTNRAQGSRSYSWAVADNVTSLARIRVTATDPVSNTASDASDVDFTIAANPDCGVESASVSLPSGWSLISLPLIPTNTGIENVLGSVLNKVLAVWRYSGGTSGTWSSYSPGGPPGLTTMEAGKAYWINLAAGGPYTLTIQGRKWSCPLEVPPTYSYVAGWNLVGYKSLANKTVGTYLPQVGAQHNTPISGYFSGASIAPADGENMLPWRGYWVYFTGAGPWTASIAAD